MLCGCASQNVATSKKNVESSWTPHDIDYIYAKEKLSAESGDPAAQLKIGIMYENGWGVKKDLNKAYRWYAQAARDNRKIARILGNTNYLGQNVESLIAGYKLAVLYYRGEGIHRDLVESYSHISAVIKLSNGIASLSCCGHEFLRGAFVTQHELYRLRDEVKLQMTGDQLHDANRMLSW